MYDLLKFMDSPQVREYNKDTYFTPAEWALIIANSITAAMEEKLDALQYLVDHYGEEDFSKESVNVGPGHSVYHSHLPSREDVRKSIRGWKKALADRDDGVSFVYAARYGEKGRYWPCGVEKYRFFPAYEKAFMFLRERRDELQEKGSFRKEDFWGEIERLKIGDRKECGIYIFDGELRMVGLFPNKDRSGQADGSDINFLDDSEAYMELLSRFTKREI